MLGKDLGIPFIRISTRQTILLAMNDHANVFGSLAGDRGPAGH